MKRVKQDAVCAGPALPIRAMEMMRDVDRWYAIRPTWFTNDECIVTLATDDGRLLGKYDAKARTFAHAAAVAS